jgi:hypothetical protein
MAKLSLPSVTLCAATSVNVTATISALRACLEQIDFAECILMTDAEVPGGFEGVRVLPITKLHSSGDYSEFMIMKLVDHVRTSHCLVVQWDGFVLDAACWDPHFLDYDYIGAPWPQFDDYDVGNGGFSLRSRKLLEACKDPAFQYSHPEDVAICRINRPMLESRHSIRFADRSTAERFSFERSAADGRAFGFHGVFNMIPALGAEKFWNIYRTLDEPSTAFADFPRLFRHLGAGPKAMTRRLHLTSDRLAGLFRR